MDVQVRRAVTDGLRLKEVDVLTAQEDGFALQPDPELLDRAAGLGRVVFTHDDDFLAEAHRRQHAGIPFTGVIYVHQLRLTVGQCVDQLEVLAKLGEPEEFRNRVTYLSAV
jgi:predicted nuclease of predicted toxin-antitoxin system